jgi:acyl dehydratase
MAEERLITEEMTKTIGQLLATQVVEIEKGMIERYFNAVGDPNPLWADEAYAKKSRYGGIIAPPSFVYGLNYLCKPAIEVFFDLQPFKVEGYSRYVDGGIECEFITPIKAGDVLFSSVTLTDLYERKGSSGKMLFVVYKVNWINQKGEAIANVYRTVIRY